MGTQDMRLTPEISQEDRPFPLDVLYEFIQQLRGEGAYIGRGYFTAAATIVRWPSESTAPESQDTHTPLLQAERGAEPSNR